MSIAGTVLTGQCVSTDRASERGRRGNNTTFVQTYVTCWPLYTNGCACVCVWGEAGAVGVFVGVVWCGHAVECLRYGASTAAVQMGLCKTLYKLMPCSCIW